MSHSSSFLNLQPVNPSILAMEEKKTENAGQSFKIYKNSNLDLNKRLNTEVSYWVNREKLYFLVFVIYFRHLFLQNKEWKDCWALFKALAYFIKTRNPRQCRSYSLKTLKRFQSIENFIKIAQKRTQNLS